jgi:hypothetical protein
MNEFITGEGLRVQDHDQQVMQQALTNLTKTLRETYPACAEEFIVGEPAEEVALSAHELDADQSAGNGCEGPQPSRSPVSEAGKGETRLL